MLTELLSKIKKKKFFLNILTLVSGSAIVQIIGVLLSPIISRLYSPESFGIIGVIIATSTIVSTISSLKLELAIVLEKNNNFANAIQTICFKILGIISLLYVCFLFFSTVIFDWFKNENQHQFIWFSVPIMIGMGIYNIFRERLNRETKYKLLATANITQKLSNNLLQILLGFLGAKAIGLITGNLFGIIISLALIIFTEKKLFIKFEGSRKLQKLLFRKYHKFPLYSAPQNVLNTVSQQLPVYLLGYYYGAEVVGFYWFAMRLIQIPSDLISNSIRQVFFKEASVSKNDLPRLKKLYFKLTKNLALIIILPAIIFFVIAPWFFNLIFGEQWVIAGEYAKWMFLWISIGFINPPSVILFNVFNNQNILFKLEILLIVFRAGALTLGGHLNLESIDTIILFSCVGILFNSILIGLSYYTHFIKQKSKV